MVNLNYTLSISVIGAITGIISLLWHISNSRLKIILERVSFMKADRHSHKVTIDVKATIRNKSNRATTIEDIYFQFGNIILSIKEQTLIKINPNSSYKLIFSRSITPDEFSGFKELKSRRGIKLGLTITHTFGRIERYGYTHFNTPWLNLS
jgi:S-adenosylmethionine hydrolase